MMIGEYDNIEDWEVAAQIDDSVRTPLNEQLDRLGSMISTVSYTHLDVYKRQ